MYYSKNNSGFSRVHNESGREAAKRKNLKRLALKVVRFRLRLVETTSRSPHGESVLPKGRGSFQVGCRQAAELAREGIFVTLAGRETCVTLACCGRALSSCLWGISEHNKRTAFAVLLAVLVE